MTTKRDLAIEAILTRLYGYGDTYTGNHPHETAGEWYDAGFSTPDEVSDWCTIGVWDPWTAAVLVKDMTPAEVSEAVECFKDGVIVLHNLHVIDAFNYGNPIYSMCNGDLSPIKFVKAWKSR